MTARRITAPTAEPVDLATAKTHCNVIGTGDDAYITALIIAARQGAEHITGRSLMPQTWEITLDAFPDAIQLSAPPLASVTSVKYLDSSGAQQTLDPADYLVDAISEPGYVVPGYGKTWPATYGQINAVTVRYIAGYATAADVSQEIKAWMLLRIGMLYANRESVVPGISIAELPFVDRLLDSSRIWGN